MSEATPNGSMPRTPSTPSTPSTPNTPSTPDDGVDAATHAFTEHRELLFSMVYNLLGTVADTEDVLQETWLSWSARNRATETGPINHPRAYLVRVAVNKALARQVEVSRRRESYFGPWLPEPLVAHLDADVLAGPAEDPVEHAEAVSIALLVVLETLTPLERAVFVLHEVFGYAHTETAEVLGRSPAAVRQLAHRAREHVQARRPRFRTDPQLRQQVTERFAGAVADGDLTVLLDLLAPDVTLWADGGGKATAAGAHPVHGRDKVARLLAGGANRAPDGVQVHWGLANGDPSALLFAGAVPFAVLVLDLTPDGERIAGVYFLTNPDKLSRVR
ncbi:RNA polymerase sigma factor SigJ [Kitasatospora sp. NPDC052868]|uniref:RNA polymerase sigma factor SigJ n=1 Tax=Kitasatospora sp. NPDC052868 TaxID=3364060 RepID=UPI0037CB168D